MRPRDVLAGLGILLALSIGAGVGRVGVGVARGDADGQKVGASAAMSWLALIDGGRYAESWKQASAYFRGVITEAGWDTALRGARAPLGDVQSRNVRTTKEAKSLPGAPDGQYVVMEFDTSFANKISAIEMVTFVQEPDGRWRAAGYFIR